MKRIDSYKFQYSFKIVFLWMFISIFMKIETKFNEISDSFQEYSKFFEELKNEENADSPTYSENFLFDQKQKDIFKLIEKSDDFIEYAQNDQECLENEYLKENKISNNKRFILGKCNPILIVAGFLGTRLRAVIDCPNLIKDQEILSELRFFCGKNICKDSFFSSFSKEEYTLWPSLFNSPFKIFQDSSNPDNSCMAYFMRIFNDEYECPFLETENQTTGEKINKPICLYNKYVKVTYFGNTEITEKDINCGLRPICRIIDSGYPIIPEKYTNSPATEGFYKMTEALLKKGYFEGFSIAGLPYDFRVLSKKNSSFEKKFFDLVKMLKKNTGKKVIVVSHSLGNLFTNNILSNISNQDFLNDFIERNIALVPPYIGTSKDIELFITGTAEFKSEIFNGHFINISFEAQKFMGAFNPNFYLLLLKPFLSELSKKKEYNKFTEAIFERVNLERKCKHLINFEEKLQNFNEECNDDFIERNSVKFSNIFPFIPKLNSEVCKNLFALAKDNITNSNFNKIKAEKRRDIYEYLPMYESCFLRIYDFMNCPIIKAKNSNETSIDVNNFEELCINSHENDNKGKENIQDYYFANECVWQKNESNCQEKFIKDFITYDSSNLFPSKSSIKNQIIPEKFNINNTEFHQTVDIMMIHSKEINPNKEILRPNVPTSIVYGSFLDTKTAFYYKKDQKDTLFDPNQIYFFGGDGTVTTYSSLLPALKWIYDSNLNKNPTDVEILNYCSFLSREAEYNYFENKKNKINKIFYALDCECLDEKGYNLEKISKDKDKCSHSSMVSDKYVIDFIYHTSSKKSTYDKIEKYPQEIVKAFIEFDENNEFLKNCNKKLRID